LRHIPLKPSGFGVFIKKGRVETIDSISVMDKRLLSLCSFFSKLQ
jgi:hypothetical protein